MVGARGADTFTLVWATSVRSPFMVTISPPEIYDAGSEPCTSQFFSSTPSGGSGRVDLTLMCGTGTLCEKVLGLIGAVAPFLNSRIVFASVAAVTAGDVAGVKDLLIEFMEPVISASAAVVIIIVQFKIRLKVRRGGRIIGGNLEQIDDGRNVCVKRRKSRE